MGLGPDLGSSMAAPWHGAQMLLMMEGVVPLSQGLQPSVSSASSVSAIVKQSRPRFHRKVAIRTPFCRPPLPFQSRIFSGVQMFPPEAIIQVLYMVAIIVEAMTAAIAAGRRQMDWLGVCVLGSVTALGGGSMRDILLDHHPLSWVERPYLLLVTGGAALATIALAKLMPKLRHLFLVLDAIGLVVFTVIGCKIAESLDLPVLIVITSGVITGCVGGVLRDMLCAQVPLLFRAELYATVSVVAGGAYLGTIYMGMGETLALLVAAAIGLALRLAAIRFRWSLPKFTYAQD